MPQLSNIIFISLLLVIPLHILLIVIPITRTLRAVISVKNKIFRCGLLLFFPILGVGVFNFKYGTNPYQETVITFYFLAPFLVIFGIILWGFEEGKFECSRICEGQGYADIRYIAADIRYIILGRSGRPAACYCLTKEEAEYSVIFSEESVPIGKRVYW